jgi:membrane protein DedA with SNARE-associated domain
MGPKEAEQWLNEHGFSFTFSNQLLQYISILAPFLAAPVGSVLKFQ